MELFTRENGVTARFTLECDDALSYYFTCAGSLDGTGTLAFSALDGSYDGMEKTMDFLVTLVHADGTVSRKPFRYDGSAASLYLK